MVLATSGNYFDLDQILRRCKLGFDRGARWRMALGYPGVPDLVHRGKIPISAK